jgi:hypothetical protein
MSFSLPGRGESDCSRTITAARRRPECTPAFSNSRPHRRPATSTGGSESSAASVFRRITARREPATPASTQRVFLAFSSRQGSISQRGSLIRFLKGESLT